MKFKVGDSVRLDGNWTDMKYDGKTATIIQVIKDERCYLVDLDKGKWVWDEEELMLDNQIEVKRKVK